MKGSKQTERIKKIVERRHIKKMIGSGRIKRMIESGRIKKIIRRRDFVRTATLGSIAGALFASGQLPLLSAEPSRFLAAALSASEGNPKNLRLKVPYAVRDITGQLQEFEPAPGILRNREKYLLAYDVISWNGRSVRTGMTRHVPAGRLFIGRKKTSDGIEYSVRRNLRPGALNRLRVKITCQKSGLPAVKYWSLESEQEPLSAALKDLAAFKETGEVEQDRIVIKRGSSVTEFTGAKTVLTQWQIPEIVSGFKPGSRALIFDLMQDCALLKRGLKLHYDGPVEIAVSHGLRIKLHSFLLIGRGILPTHYLVDEKGLPQLIVAGMLSFCLKRIG